MANKTILITGSSCGLGESLALVFASNKYDIILHGRNEERLAKVGAAVLEFSVACDIVKGDLAKEATIDELYDTARRRDIDVLVNNAAIYPSRDFQDLADTEVRRIMEINLIAPILLTKRVFSIFRRWERGLIMNINSFAGKNPGEGEAIYCASKHGLRGFTRSIQFDATQFNIRIVDIYLGAMKTEMTKNRPAREKFIQPSDAAYLIFCLAENYHSMIIKEIDIGRRNY